MIQKLHRARQQRGASTLEMACCLPPLVSMLCAAVDYSSLAVAQHQMAHAARSASRYGITGQTDVPIATVPALVPLCTDSGVLGQSARLDRIRAIIAAEAGGILKLAQLCLTVGSYAGYQGVGRPEPLADINGNGRHDPGEAFTDINGNGVWDADQATPSPGSADTVAVYTLRYLALPVTGITPGLTADRLISLQTRMVVRNEPF